MSDLIWEENSSRRLVSAAATFGVFKIVYDGTSYWPSWSKESSVDLESLKAEAQSVHESYK
jgi:hypothetical protein